MIGTILVEHDEDFSPDFPEGPKFFILGLDMADIM
jgi:hypothetical protein